MAARRPRPKDVLRVGRPGVTTEARPADFEFNDAERRQNPRTISVWDDLRTNANQAVSFLTNPKGPRPVFTLPVEEMQKIGFKGQRLRVEPDPDGVPEWARGLAGSDGHCAVHGLQRPPLVPNAKKKALMLRQKLADMAVLVSVEFPDRPSRLPAE